MRWYDQAEMKSNALLHRVNGRERIFPIYFPFSSFHYLV